MKRLFCIFCMCALHLSFGQSSVLSEGTWFKVGVTTTGIYKIDLNTLSALGVSSSVQPAKIKLYGNGLKGILPQANADDRPVDLIENAIFVSGESDGQFNSDDYILFYGVGPDKNRWESSGFEYEKNIYSDTTFYFIKIDGEQGKRITSQSNLAGATDATVTSFDDAIVFEEDRSNLISSGRGWYGETLASGDSKSFTHQIDEVNSSLKLTLSAVSRSSQNATFGVTVNGASVGAVVIDPIPSGPGSTYSIKAKQQTQTFSIPSSSTLNLAIKFNGNGSGEIGYIDYYHLTFQRNLRFVSNEIAFRWINNVGQLLKYEILNASESTIWNVTDPTNTVKQEHSSVADKAIFQSKSNQVEEFLVFKGSDFPTPFIFGNVPNQDLHGDVGYDALIITNPNFKQAADQLAEFHQTHDNLTVKVVTTSEVYNEFSSGRQDVSAIRDYAKYVYEKGGKLKYLLLLGDCSYDYKDRVAGNTNYVPTYESRESFHPIYSYSSDDYFGFFEDTEGTWLESIAGDHTLEIGIGRLPAKSLQEATDMVDKIIYYSTSVNTLGKWKSEVTYVADDGDGNVHVRHVEDLSELIDTTYAQYNINKILLDAYQQESSGSVERSPQASASLKTRIKNGTFYVNYIGHGNERLWMEEEILSSIDIERLTNRNKLPIFVTATCEFGRYDDPIKVSGAERLLLRTQGGGIALLTTSRPVLASTNFSLNKAFHKNIFRQELGQSLRLGDVIRLTKNEGLEGAVNRNFTLLGDPMLMPSYPGLDVVIKESSSVGDTLSALEKITFEGEIQENGSLQTDFNGKMIVGVFDLKQVFKTKGQESSPYPYTLRSNALFRGESSVTSGKFSFSFIVPKNISYQYKKGKMSLYAWDEKNNVDADGSSRSFVIGGTANNPPEDSTPPEINAYMNDSSFVDGGLVGKSPLLIAHLADESGITTSRSGVVEGITLTIGDTEVNLNDFYSSKIDDYQKGTIVYPLQELAPGDYAAKLRVWDTYNNSSETVIRFRVADEPTLFVYNPLVYPNPVSMNTTFSFEHDREDEDLDIVLLVYNSQGKEMNRSTFRYENSPRIIKVSWQAITNTGSTLTQGVYHAKMIIRSTLDGASKEIYQKLIIL